MDLLDFLRKGTPTPLCEYFLAAGAVCELSTNSPQILKVAGETFVQLDDPPFHTDLRLTLWVHISAQAAPPWPNPYFRGLNHLVFVGFDAENSLLIDLRSRRALGRFSPAMAADRDYWKKVIFPVLIGIASAFLGITALHCACCVRDDMGLVLAGDSGSGKSTLSLTLAQNGFALLSDGWTYFSRRGGRLLAWGLLAPVKLLPDAATHFPELVGLEPAVALNDELAFELEPERVFGVTRARSCEPRWIVFLERQESPGFGLTEMDPAVAAARFEEQLEDIPPDFSDARRSQLETIQSLVQCECWSLRYGGKPQTVARGLMRFLSGRGEGQKARALVPWSHKNHTQPRGFDPLRRLTPTPYSADVAVMGRAVRLETNSPAILDQARRTFEPSGKTPAGEPEFLWRLVSEADSVSIRPWPEARALREGSLGFVTLGQRCFFAVDLKAREAVGFLSEELLRDEPGFTSVYLASLFTMTASALRLVPISAVCVALEGRGLLLFGPSKSGKTTSGYLARKLGLEFLADKFTYLEYEGGLRAWGDFSPPSFHAESIQFLPELLAVERLSTCRDRTFFHLEESSSDARQGRPVTPVCCVFLEREAARTPRLIPVPSREFADRLKESMPFGGEDSFEAQRIVVRHALGELPAYRLAYGKDPAQAATFLHRLLSEDNRLEAPA